MLARSGAYGHGVRSSAHPDHVAFLYLGRRGLGRFTLELARHVAELRHVRATFCISRQNEIFSEFAHLGCRVLPVDTFEGGGGALMRGYRVRTLYRNVLDELMQQRSAGVVTLMPHVWTPLFAPLLRKHGFRYLTVIHDAQPHPGDPTSLVNGWALRDALNADPVVTLSRSVADILADTRAVPRQRLVPLFHPDLHFGASSAAGPGASPAASPETNPGGIPDALGGAASPAAAGPFRILFFGRILAYKGLPALVEAVATLRAEDLPVQLGVFGDGLLGLLRPRLEALGAEVENRWIADREVAGIFARYHAVALPHSECSQSGVAAVALGAGLPVVGACVGGLAEQVKDGATGILARGCDPASLAAAIRRLATDRKLYAHIRTHIRRTAWERSMRRFAEHLVALATNTGALPFAPQHEPARPERTWV